MPVGIAQYHLQQVGHAVGVLECDVFLPENRDALVAALLKLPRQICLLCLWVLPPLQPGIHCLLVEIVPIRRHGPSTSAAVRQNTGRLSSLCFICITCKRCGSSAAAVRNCSCTRLLSAGSGSLAAPRSLIRDSAASSFGRHRNDHASLILPRRGDGDEGGGGKGGSGDGGGGDSDGAVRQQQQLQLFRGR
eukprot:scaffold10110_cov69-Phaeocystis_antarctica.AAC.18